MKTQSENGIDQQATKISDDQLIRKYENILRSLRGEGFWDDDPDLIATKLSLRDRKRLMGIFTYIGQIAKARRAILRDHERTEIQARRAILRDLEGTEIL